MIKKLSLSLLLFAVVVAEACGAGVVNPAFIQQGTGAQSRTFLEKARDTLALKDFQGGSVTCDTAFNNAITRAAAVSGDLLINTGTCSITNDRTVAANVRLRFQRGAMLSIAVSKTLTLNGEIDAPVAQIFNGSGVVAFPQVSPVAFVRPEWWGAVTYATRAAALAGSDALAAFTAAAATGKTLQLAHGIYSVSNEVLLNAVGQGVWGAVMRNVSGLDSGAGSAIVARAGFAGTNLLHARQTHHEIRDMALDGNAAASCLLLHDGTKFSRTYRMDFKNASGFALREDGDSNTNFNWFDDLHFRDGNYGHIEINHANYDSFGRVSGGSATGGIALSLNATGAHTYEQGVVAIHFDYLGLTEGQVYIRSAGTSILEGISIASMLQDTGTIFPASGGTALRIDGVTVQGVSIGSFRINRNIAATSRSVVSIKDARNVVITNGYLREQAGAAGYSVFDLDGAFGLEIANVQVFSQNAFKAVNNTGARSDSLVVRNVNSISGGAGSNVLKSYNAYIGNTNIAQTFAAGSQNIVLENIAATITPANAVDLHTRNSSSYPFSLNGGSGAAQGPVINLEKDGAVVGGVGAESAVRGTGTSSDLMLKAETGLCVKLAANGAGASPVLTACSTGVKFAGQSEPTCSSTTRGTVVLVQGGAGVADTFRVCTKDVADVYGYRALF